MKNRKLKEGEKLKLDSYRVKQYENERVCDEVTVLEDSSSKKKLMLCYSPKLAANILVPREDLNKLN